MDAFLRGFEKLIAVSLCALMVVVVLAATVDLGWKVISDIAAPPIGRLKVEQLLDIFGPFLLILIGIELLETIKTYLREHVIRAEVVLEVALIAIARKVIILEAKDMPPVTLLGMASLILVLSVAHHLRRRGAEPRGRAAGLQP